MTPARIRNHSILAWLTPGMHIKRWLLLMMVGMALMGLGAAYLLKEAYLSYEFPNYARELTLQFLPRWVRGLTFLSLALGTVGVSIWKLNESLLYAFVRPGSDKGMAQTIIDKRVLSRGPNVVTIGGGTGLSMLLRGLKTHTSNLTAIVTVADDGGSSGRLREDFGVMPPGDIRQCIAALAEAEPLMTRLFQYRFTDGEGLEGHSFGNLFIVAMADVTGNFETAIHETSRVLNVRGTILPSTLEDVTLSARTHEDEVVHGEHNITQHGASIQDVFLNPSDAQAHPDAVRAIMEAELLVIGPGSLYTSVLPNLLVQDIQKAVHATSATKVFVCNVATQHGETDEFGVAEHLEALERHTGKHLIHAVVVNNNVAADLPEEWHSQPVELSRPGAKIFEGVRIVEGDVVSEDNRYRHDPDKLAAMVMRLYDDRRGLVAEVVLSRPQTAVAASSR